MSAPSVQLITSRSEFQAAVRFAFAHAAEHGCREIWLCDPDFEEWPLGEREVVEHLTQWAQAHRRLTLVANSFDQVPRRHTRWVEWRRVWSHVVHCRTNTELEISQFPTGLVMTSQLSVSLSDRVHHRGRLSNEVADAVHCKELIDAVLQRSDESFPVTTTGL